MTKIGTDISLAVHLLKEGLIIAIPTETVYGLAGNALNEDAVTNIFTIKNRPFFDPLIVHTDQLSKLSPLIGTIPEPLQMLARHFMPGPLTILVEKTEQMSDLVTSGSRKVAIRIPNHPLTLALLSRLDFPLAAPSANPFGYVSPTTAQHVADQLGDKVSYILDGGSCQIGLESTIVDYRENQIVVLRKGGIPIEEIEALVGPVQVYEQSSSRPSAPGMLDQHYAPSTPLTLQPLEEVLQKFKKEKIGYLAFDKLHPDLPNDHQKVLSPSGNLSEAAHHFFRYLREFDKMDLEIIAATLVPDRDLGRAINDKLKRGAIKN
ncbi:MAG: threonylcarbamoyl-AMP synthase [Saprospiraceae bacterium]|nr:threonylcarbamoyl-AMP synthase [Saprospiraceae bacterium]